MKLLYQLIDGLMASPHKVSLMALNKVLALGIPFNAPHGFKIQSLTEEEIRIDLPNSKLNHNHLGGIHACAMATVGEFCAGLSILSSFGMTTYRPILAELHIKYSYQGRVDLEGVCNPHQIKKDEVHEFLRIHGAYLQSLETIVREKESKREVAVVYSTWQIKNWERVKLK